MPPDDGRDRRAVRTEFDFRWAQRVAPALAAIHPLEAHEPEECVFLLQNSVVAMTWDAMADVPRYADWLLEAPLHAAYRHYRAQLQGLAGDRPGAIVVLKSPCHLYALDALLATFPDACIVHTHRELREVMPSCFSLFGAYRLVCGRGVDLTEAGPRWLAFWGRAMDKALDARRRADPARFYDLPYRELVADPLAAAARLLEHFGFPCDGDARAAMGAWLGAQPRDRPAHRYSLAQFGVTESELAQRFARYTGELGAAPRAQSFASG